MKKHKFSERLPESGKVIFCQIWDKYTLLKDNLAYGVFKVTKFENDRGKGIELESIIDFIFACYAGAVDPCRYRIYENEQLDDKLIWWADPEED